MFGESGFGSRKKKADEADLDITPMIDVTFLLLIFFMVTSTMQGTPDKDIPPAKNGTNANAAGFKDLTLLAPQSAGVDSEILFNGNTVSLDQLKAELIQITEQKVEIMIYAERDVKSGFVGEVETIIGEAAADSEKEILTKFAVRDKR